MTMMTWEGLLPCLLEAYGDPFRHKAARKELERMARLAQEIYGPSTSILKILHVEESEETE